MSNTLKFKSNNDNNGNIINDKVLVIINNVYICNIFPSKLNKIVVILRKK